MTMRNCWAKTIPVLWCSALCGCIFLVSLGAAAAPAQRKHATRKATQRRTAPKSAASQRPETRRAKPVSLATLVESYRTAPTAARRTAVESWALSHPADAPAARLALGVVAYEQKDYDSAIASLRRAAPALPRISDYTAYYLAAAEVESKNFDTALKDLARLHAAAPASPLAGRSWLLDARAAKASDPAAAVKLLRDHYADLPQPEGDVTLADAYQAAGDLPNAAQFYQRVYYQYLSGDALDRAAAALLTIKDTLGAAYPQPLPQQKLHRADLLLQARKFDLARAEYQVLVDQVPALEREQALVRLGAVDYRSGRASRAYSYLNSLAMSQPAADAERLYYLTECARDLSNDDGMMSAVKQLADKYPQSHWRLKALVSAASRYLLINQPDNFLPLYQAVYETFPDDPIAGLCHWKVTFQAYLRGKENAGELLREHLRKYPLHATAGAALYFLGRLSEREKDYAGARACYQQLDKGFENYYYGALARERLKDPQVQKAGTSPKMAEFLAGVAMPQAQPVPADATAPTTLRIARSRILRTAGLDDLADRELRFGARTDGQPDLIAMEMATQADAVHQGLRFMKSMAPDYLSLKLEQAPRRFWELLYPLPYREELTADARRSGLDPFVVAGLIRQESEFNPDARSRANACGLTQVQPATGRIYARRAGVGRFSSRLLFQPSANLKIGTTVLRAMLDQNGGSMEHTLASYNAGPNRVAEWLTWNSYREPAEFVESIPYSETRDYVQAVLRNAEIYRRLYR
jgi:soluble lytic murein transglycosylase